MEKKRMRRYGAGLWLCLAVSAAIGIGAFAANEPTYRSAFAKDPADSTLYLYAAAVQTATCVVSSPVTVSAAEACALEITERFVCMASEFIDADALRGTEVIGRISKTPRRSIRDTACMPPRALRAKLRCGQIESSTATRPCSADSITAKRTSRGQSCSACPKTRLRFEATRRIP